MKSIENREPTDSSQLGTRRFDEESALTESLGCGYRTKYVYDAFGNLLAVAIPDGPVVAYVIDAENRRIGKKVDTELVTGFLWQDDLRVAAELDGQNNVVSTFVYGTKVNVPEYMVKPSGPDAGTYRIITDHLGSVRLVVDASSGVVRERMDFDEFGRVTNRAEFDATGSLLPVGTPPFQPFGFAGGLYDHLTGLTRFGARDYDAESGRWTAKDPILFGGGQANLYVYVGNDPVNFIDPLGLAWGVGWTLDLNAILPFLSGGGGSAGINVMFTSSNGFQIFRYIPKTDPSAGVCAGVASKITIAWGEGGPWEGNFYNLEGNVGPVSAGYFTGDYYHGGPGWQGINVGVGPGLPVGVSSNATEYGPVFP